MPKLPIVRGPDLSRASDGKKKVVYRPTKSRSVRAFQTEPPATAAPTRFVPVAAKPSSVPKQYPEFIITPHVPYIFRYIQQHSVLAVDARTGTGKTRATPYYIAKQGLRVRVAIPTTVAVRDAYNFQKTYSDLRIGYAAGREIHYSDDDQLVYATTGHFRQRILGMLKSGEVSQIRFALGDVMFVDEVHTATTDISVLIALLRHLFTVNGSYSGPRIVFATATFNHGDIMDHFKDFPVYTVPDVAKPIEDIFLEAPFDPIGDDPDQHIIRLVKGEFERWKAGTKVHGIIFRPGVHEVETTIESLEQAFSSKEPIEFYPAYSGLTPQEIDSIFEPSDNMKVVVGTNLIESSITISDVGWIINDMLVKIAETSSTGGEKLTLSLISQAGAKQRRGRTGRTVPGRAYYLMTESQYELLPPFTLREIDRIPIYDIILQLIDANLDPVTVLRIDPARVEQGKKTLIDFGMLEQKETGLVVTDAGRFVSGISLGIQNSFMVYLGYQRFMGKYQQSTEISSEKILLRSIIAVASMIETYGPSYMFIPRRKRDETQFEYQARRDAHVEKYHEKFRGETDIHTFVNIFWEMLTDINVAKQHDRATGYKITHYVKEWAINNSMNNRKLKEFFTVMRDIESVIESKINQLTLRDASPVSSYTETLPRGLYGQDGFSLGRNLPTGGYTHLGNAIAPIFARAYIANQMRKEPEFRGRVTYRAGTGVSYSIDRISSFNRLSMTRLDSPAEIVAARTLEMVGKTGRYHLAGIIVSEKYIPRLREVPVAPVAPQAAPPASALPLPSFLPPLRIPSAPITSPSLPISPPSLPISSPGAYIGPSGLPVLGIKR